jgi:ligand-binding sensor domain-containing protein
MKKQLFLVFSLLALLQSAVFSQILSRAYLNGTNVTGMVEFDGYLWVSTYGQGIFRYSFANDEWFNYSQNNKNAENNFYYCIAASKSFVWAGGADGLYILNLKSNKWQKKKFALGGEMGNWIRALCYDPSQNVLWIGRFENLTRLDVEKQQYTDHILLQDKDSRTNNFKSIVLDGDSLIWFGTEGGVFKFRKKMNVNNPNAWLFINNKNSGFKNAGDAVSISDILCTKPEVWFGTDEFKSIEHPNFNLGGIFIYDRKKSWIRLSVADGLPADGVYCLSRTGNSIWAGIYSFNKSQKKDYGQGLVIINRFTSEISSVNLNQLNIHSAKITALHFDGTSMWIGTDNGLCKVLIENPLAVWPGKQK